MDVTDTSLLFELASFVLVCDAVRRLHLKNLLQCAVVLPQSSFPHCYPGFSTEKYPVIKRVGGRLSKEYHLKPREFYLKLS